jgi:hypothetical protein
MTRSTQHELTFSEQIDVQISVNEKCKRCKRVIFRGFVRAPSNSAKEL